MPCANTDARAREDTAAGGGGVDPIAAILQRRPSIPDGGDDLGLEAKEAGSMVARRRREGERRDRKTRKSTGKNDAAKRGQTDDEERNKKGLILWPWQASYLACWSEKIPPCLFRSSHRILLDCEAFFRLILDVKCLCADLY